MQFLQAEACSPDLMTGFHTPLTKYTDKTVQLCFGAEVNDVDQSVKTGAR